MRRMMGMHGSHWRELPPVVLRCGVNHSRNFVLHGAFLGNLWYCGFALITSVVLCGPSGAVAALI